MSLQTRRRLLRGAGASLLAALAGCTGSESSSQSSTPHGPRPENLVTDYDYFELRSPSPRPVFRDAESDENDSTLGAFLVTTPDDWTDIDVAYRANRGDDYLERSVEDDTYRSARNAMGQYAYVQFVARETPETSAWLLGVVNAVRDGPDGS